MKKYFLAAAIATAPMLSATSADAITVPVGSSLEITINGQYTTQDGGDIGLGSVLNLGSAFVNNINPEGPGIDLNGLSQFSFVSAPAAFSLVDGANTGSAFTFLAAGGASFSITQTGGSFVVPAGANGGTGSSGQVGLGILANGSTDSGSFSFGTTSDSSSGAYQITFAVPPAKEIQEEFSPIPLPAAAWMLLAGLGSLWAFRRRTHA